MKITAWMQAAVLALMCSAVAQAQSPIPKELEGWQNWVQDGLAFRHCPFFANTDGGSESNRICAWPGRLTLELNQRGGRFTQTWESYSEGRVPLPGNLAMLLWALWRAFALVRWLPIAWKALGSGGFWRKKQRSAMPPPAVAG